MGAAGTAPVRSPPCPFSPSSDLSCCADRFITKVPSTGAFENALAARPSMENFGKRAWSKARQSNEWLEGMCPVILSQKKRETSLSSTPVGKVWGNSSCHLYDYWRDRHGPWCHSFRWRVVAKAIRQSSPVKPLSAMRGNLPNIFCMANIILWHNPMRNHLSYWHGHFFMARGFSAGA